MEEYKGLGCPSVVIFRAYIRGQLSLIERLRVINHVARCVDCARHVLAIRQEPGMRDNTT